MGKPKHSANNRRRVQQDQSPPAKLNRDETVVKALSGGAAAYVDKLRAAIAAHQSEIQGAIREQQNKANAKDEELADSLMKHVKALPESDGQLLASEFANVGEIANGQSAIVRSLKERTEISLKLAEELCQAVEKSDVAVKEAQETQCMGEDCEEKLEQVTKALALGHQAIEARTQLHSNIQDDDSDVASIKFSEAQRWIIEDVFGLRVVDAKGTENDMHQVWRE